MIAAGAGKGDKMVILHELLIRWLDSKPGRVNLQLLTQTAGESILRMNVMAGSAGATYSHERV